MSQFSRPLVRWAAHASGGLAVAALLVGAPGPSPVAAATSAPDGGGLVAAATGTPGPAAHRHGAHDDERNAQAERRLERAVAQRASGTGHAGRAAADGSVRVITYDASGAPSFQQEIQRAVAIWNQALTGVELVPAPPGWADFAYYEGERGEQPGSYAATQYDGYGYVFLEYAYLQQFDPLRNVTHETGHILGLPDHYEGPCSELMSGGAAGADCHNPYPNATEVAGAEAAMAATRPWQQSWGWSAYAS